MTVQMVIVIIVMHAGRAARNINSGTRVYVVLREP